MRIQRVAPSVVDAAYLAAIARTIYADVPTLLRQMQQWRPYICPFERLVGHVSDGAHVLDVGCGAGLLLGLLAGMDVAFDGIGVDVSWRAIAAANTMARRVAAINPKARLAFQHLESDTAWPVGTFDVVFLIDVLHHIPTALQSTLFHRALATVAPGGLLVYKDMCRRPWWKAQANRCHDLLLAREWVTYCPITTVEQWATAKAMTVVLREEIGRMCYGHELLIMRRSDHTQLV